MIPRLRTRAPGTRATRFDPRQRRLESLAGEFALLTQRRARTLHQLELLDQQRAAAAANLDKVQSRLAWLVQHMDTLDPGLRDPAGHAEPEPEPPPPPPSPARRLKPGIGQSDAKPGAKPGTKPGTKPGAARPWAAVRSGPRALGTWRGRP